MHKYDEVLDWQLNLIRRWSTSDKDFELLLADSNSSKETKREAIAKLHDDALFAVKQASAYFISDDICKLLQAAAKDLPSIVAEEPDLPYQCGICKFESPIPTPQNKYHIAGILWATCGPDLSRPPTGVGLFPILTNPNLPVCAALIEFGKQWFKSDTANEVNQASRMLLALSLFTKQRLLITSKHNPTNRSLKRRLDKTKPLHDPEILVIKLRHRDSISDNPNRTSQEWSCHWIVRGHWRQQWYRSAQKYRPKWICPYVKGPADKPFKEPDIPIYAVIR